MVESILFFDLIYLSMLFVDQGFSLIVFLSCFFLYGATLLTVPKNIFKNVSVCWLIDLDGLILSLIAFCN